MFLSLIFLTLPPLAPKQPISIQHHEEKYCDDYYWLKDKDNPDTLSYLEAENTYTQSMMAHTEELQEKLYTEMKERIEERDSSVPVQKGEYFYYHRFEEGKSYPFHCRKKCSLEAPEEIFLDENELASAHAFFSLNSLALDYDQTKIAFGYDTKGDEHNKLRIKDLHTKELLPDQLYPQVGNAVFTRDGKALFYLIPDAQSRPYKVYKHILGQDPKSDALILEEKEPGFELHLKKSKDDEVMFILAESQESTFVYKMDLKDPDTLELILPYKKGVKYFVENYGDEIFILTNDGAPNYKLVAQHKGTSREIVPHRPKIFLEEMEVFQGGIALFERENFRQQIEWIDCKTGCVTKIRFQEPTYTIYRKGNLDLLTPYLRFHYSSLITPKTVYDFDFATKKFTLRKQEKVNGYCPSDYEEQFFFISACDGTKIPLSLVYKKEIPIIGLLLTGYGAYGASYPLDFSSNLLSLLDRGVAYAIAHIRGGGEGGKAWYESGRLLNKKTTFTDFISCAKGLIERQITDPSSLVIEGRSAGGLLIGAVVNMCPDLFRAAIAEVPFVDLINTMTDPQLPLTVQEYEEWGNPEEEQYFKYMKSYSPYDNVEEKSYPALLVTGGMNDPRVGYWEPAKWVAKLRSKKRDCNLLLFKTNLGCGHFGPSGRFDPLKAKAFKYAFILEMLKAQKQQ